MNLQSLQVNGQVEPLALDDERILFSWEIHSKAKGMAVTGARVLASTDPSLLSSRTPDLWDSGWREGSTQMIYSGPKLQKLQRYWWAVILRDQDGNETPSEPAWFETGLLREDWQARWIWSAAEVKVNEFAYFRKECPIDRPVAKAVLYYSAHHTAQVFVNGIRINGWGSPAPTNPEKRKYYLAYDVTEHLQDQAVCLSAKALYLGGNGQNYVNGLPGFRLQLQIWHADGTMKTIGTDETWQTLIRLPHESSVPYQQNRRISAMERYDAAQERTDWQFPGFDSSQCKPAVISPIADELYPMRNQEIQEGAVHEWIVPTEVTPEAAERHQVFDAGSVMTGWVRFKLKGFPGVKLRIRYSEDLDEHGFVKHNVCNEISYNYYDEYTMRGDEEEVWETDFSFKAFRYAEIAGYPERIIPGEHVWVVYASTDLKATGSFHSSSELLNALYAAAMQTQKNNVTGQIVDCPHREQAQYLADSDLQAELLLYNFNARFALEKVLSDFADGQLEDGTFPFVYPTNYEDPAFHLQIPEWDLHYCTLMWKIYFHYDDLTVLQRFLPTAQRMVDYYLSLTKNETGLVPLDKGWHISDWPYPTVDHAGDYLTVENIKLYAAVRTISQAAALLGDERTAARYAEEAETLKANLVRGLYDPNHKRFRSSSGSAQIHQGVNALALFYGIVPEEDRQELLRYIAASPWECKTVLSLPLLRVLFEHGKEETAYRFIHKEEYPGWGYMIKQGSKTMWEGWDDIESHSHAWNGYPARLLQEYIVGIQPASPGFRRVRIQPYVPDDLQFAEGSVKTVRGRVSVRWERLDGGDLDIRIQLPPAMQGDLWINGAEDVTEVLLDHKPLWSRSGGRLAKAAGIEEVQQEKSSICISLSCGIYCFRFVRRS